MTNRGAATVIPPRAGGWAFHRAGCEWTVTSQTPDSSSIRLSHKQLMELTHGALSRRWPTYIHWSPDRSWAAVHSADGAVLWCDQTQMDIVRTQIIDHVRAALTRAYDQERRRMLRHRVWTTIRRPLGNTQNGSP
ncbi:hypothetical protein GCM10009687_67970 [Asanoa iriomotensis]|uniref:Uncharacterized protein n=1 Tax=Asanoa iriomotensis TaxID=234613 RepID=A0ABQ4C5E4_9ACTN|nr:hypothetical protein Air01nite_40980 [Asanoa iriomotensis]